MITGKINQSYGPHIIINCYDCDETKLSDMDGIAAALDIFPQKIGMDKIMPPYVFKFSGNNPQESGITGIVLLADSHVTIHTFPEKKHAFIDIFSSRDFDANLAITFMNNLFSAKEHEVEIFSRTHHFERVKNLRI